MRDIDFPAEIFWAGQGIAKRLHPRGMSDYGRCQGNAEYRTSSGGVLKCHRQSINVNGEYKIKEMWQAQYRGTSSRWKPTVQEAIDSYDAKKDMQKGEIK